jgi:hypothetical protein
MLERQLLAIKIGIAHMMIGDYQDSYEEANAQ